MPAGAAAPVDCCGRDAQGPAPPPAQADDAKAADGSSEPVTWVIRPGPPIETDYKLGKVLGQGSFGVVRGATHLATGAEVAVKTIRKALLRAADMSSLRREVEILHHLSGHPHISQLLGVYEEARHLHLVLELYKGGDLFDAIIGCGRHSERTAADVMRTVLTAISYCHAMGVAHRDIKPENFMLTAETPAQLQQRLLQEQQQQQQQQPQQPQQANGGDGKSSALNRFLSLGARLKLIDFGLSAFCTDDAPLTEIVGTSYYVAPEVLEGSYSLSADVWSAGVILHIMLTGYAPFDGRDDKEILRAVRKGKVDLTADAIWKTISREATSVMLAMLERDPKKRATADEVLAMPWLGRTAAACTASTAPLPGSVSERMHRFARMSSFKKEARRVVAGLMRPEEVAGLVAQFRGLDADRDGRLSVQELREGLARQAQLCGGSSAAASLIATLDERGLRDMVRRSDLNGDGMLDESEFLGAVLPAAAISRQAGSKSSIGTAASRPTTTTTTTTASGASSTSRSASSCNALAAAFAHFDVDGSGYITADELRRALAGHHTAGKGLDIETLLARHDRDADGRISYNEFLEMLVHDNDEEDFYAREEVGGMPQPPKPRKTLGKGELAAAAAASAALDVSANSGSSGGGGSGSASNAARAVSRGAWGTDGLDSSGGGGGRANRRRAGSGVGLLRGDSAHGGHASRSSTVAAQPPSGVASPLEWSDECESCSEYGDLDCAGGQGAVDARYGSHAARRPSAVVTGVTQMSSFGSAFARTHHGGAAGSGAHTAAPVLPLRLQPQPPPQPPSQPPPSRLSARCASANRYGAATAAAAIAAAVAGSVSVDSGRTCHDISAPQLTVLEVSPRTRGLQYGPELDSGPSGHAAAAATTATAGSPGGGGLGTQRSSRPAPPPPLQVPPAPTVDPRGRRHSTCGMVPDARAAGGGSVLLASEPRAPVVPRAPATASGGAPGVSARARPGTPDYDHSPAGAPYMPDFCHAQASPRGPPYSSAAAAIAAASASLPGSPSAATACGAASRLLATRPSRSPQHPMFPNRASNGGSPMPFSPHALQQQQLQQQQMLPLLPANGSGSTSPEGDPGPRPACMHSSPYGIAGAGGATLTVSTSGNARATASRASAAGGSPMAARHPQPYCHVGNNTGGSVSVSGGIGVSACQRANTPSAPLPVLMPSAGMRSRRQSTGSSAWQGIHPPTHATPSPMLLQNQPQQQQAAQHAQHAQQQQQPYLVATPMSPRLGLAASVPTPADAAAGPRGGSPGASRRSRRSALFNSNHDDPPLILTSRASMDMEINMGTGSRGLASEDDGFAAAGFLPPGAMGCGPSLLPSTGSVGTATAGVTSAAAAAVVASSISSRALPPSFMGLKMSASGRM